MLGTLRLAVASQLEQRIVSVYIGRFMPTCNYCEAVIAVERRVSLGSHVATGLGEGNETQRSSVVCV